MQELLDLVARVCFQWDNFNQNLIAVLFYVLEVYRGRDDVEGLEFVLEGLFEIEEGLFVLEGVKIVEEYVHHVFWLLEIVDWFFGTYLADRSVGASLA